MASALPPARLWDEHRKEYRDCTEADGVTSGGSRGALLPIAPFCQVRGRLLPPRGPSVSLSLEPTRSQIRVKKDKQNLPRLDVRKLTHENLCKPLLGWWVTSAKRKNFIWPMYENDLAPEELAKCS